MYSINQALSFTYEDIFWNSFIHFHMSPSPDFSKRELTVRGKTQVKMYSIKHEFLFMDGSTSPKVLHVDFHKIQAVMFYNQQMDTRSKPCHTQKYCLLSWRHKIPPGSPTFCTRD